MTNTTIFKETDVAEVEELCTLLTASASTGCSSRPGYHYESVERRHLPDEAEIQRKFRRVLEMSKKYRLTSTPMFLEFAAGLRDYECSPWSTVTYTPQWLEGPVLPDRQEVHAAWDEFWSGTDWDYWESRQDRAVPELRDALRLRGVGRHGAAEDPGDMLRLVGLEPR